GWVLLAGGALELVCANPGKGTKAIASAMASVNMGACQRKGTASLGIGNLLGPVRVETVGHQMPQRTATGRPRVRKQTREPRSVAVPAKASDSSDDAAPWIVQGVEMKSAGNDLSRSNARGERLVISGAQGNFEIFD